MTTKTAPFPYFSDVSFQKDALNKTSNRFGELINENGFIEKATLKYFIGNDRYIFSLNTSKKNGYVHYNFSILLENEKNEWIENRVTEEFLSDSDVFAWCNETIERNFPRGEVLEAAIIRLKGTIEHHQILLNSIEKEFKAYS